MDSEIRLETNPTMEMYYAAISHQKNEAVIKENRARVKMEMVVRTDAYGRDLQTRYIGILTLPQKPPTCVYPLDPPIASSILWLCLCLALCPVLLAIPKMDIRK